MILVPTNPTQKCVLYRKAPREANLGPLASLPTRRAPGNVSYLVDNLWEWSRPEGYPSRRSAVFCSPDPLLAQICGGAQNGSIYRVEIKSGGPILQIECKDAREHPDEKGERNLKKLIISLLGGNEFVSASLESKREIAPLWCPCLTKEEVQSIFESGRLASVAEEVRKRITLWDTARVVDPSEPLPFSSGEVFFVATEYWLTPVPPEETAIEIQFDEPF